MGSAFEQGIAAHITGNQEVDDTSRAIEPVKEGELRTSEAGVDRGGKK